MPTATQLYNEDPTYEWDRLDRDAYHRIEFDITMHHLRKHLPPSGAILDAGGGPGRYTIALCRAGYRVTLVDLASGCVEMARRRIAEEPPDIRHNLAAAEVGDIRDLSRFDAGSFDATLCLGGPLTHLPAADDRDRAVGELARVTRPGGLVATSVVGRLAVLRTIMTRFSDEMTTPYGRALLRTGDGLGPRDVPWHFFTADELRRLAEAHGIETVAMVGCESLSSGLPDATNRLAENPHKWDAWMDTLMAASDDPAVVDMSEHILHMGFT
ncbi:hypothetical protein CMK11_08800 [Candidatus Poribacteria bacterium]|nr:hypothetical protein [Candidatus Poribacteria bacterium]